MLDFFKTASGGINYGLVAVILGWIVTTFGMAAHIHKHRTEILASREAATKSRQQKEEAEARFEAAESEIARLQPKPFAERARSYLNSLNPNILPAIRHGHSVIDLRISSRQFSALQDIVEDPEAKNRIWISEMRDGEMGGVEFPDGIAYNLTIGVDPAYFANQ